MRCKQVNEQLEVEVRLERITFECGRKWESEIVLARDLRRAIKREYNGVGEIG